jgi:DNA-binding transcriptional regulator YiaG
MKSPPAAKTIRIHRKRARLSREDAAAIIYKTAKAWVNWEQGIRDMDPALWELWLIKVEKLSLV